MDTKKLEKEMHDKAEAVVEEAHALRKKAFRINLFVFGTMSLLFVIGAIYLWGSGNTDSALMFLSTLIWILIVWSMEHRLDSYRTTIRIQSGLRKLEVKLLEELNKDLEKAKA